MSERVAQHVENQIWPEIYTCSRCRSGEEGEYQGKLYGEPPEHTNYIVVTVCEERW